MLFVGIEIRRQGKMRKARKLLRQHPLAGRVRGLTHHVLPSGIASGEVKAQPTHFTLGKLLNITQLARARGGFGSGFNLGKMRGDP